MLACVRERSGLAVKEGCDLAVRLYAVAAQVYGLYVQAEWVGKQCFPQTAQGEYLDHHAQLRGLSRKAATHAQGMLRFYVTSAGTTDRAIPAGTVCMTAGLIRFETTQAGVLPAGELEVDVPAQAVEAGSEGNVTADSIVSMAVAPVGVSGCGNPQAFSGGGDAEGDEELRERVLSTFQRLPNGANAAFYQQEALSFDQVVAATVLPKARGQGTVDVMVATLTGAPDEELLEELSDYFQSRREIAVDVQVRAPELVDVAVSVQVAAAQGQDDQEVQQRVEQALRGYFTGKRLGEPVLLAQLGSMIFACEGVENYRLTAPTEDMELERDQLPVLSELTVEAMA
jgi:uncharacterized phage protein gp47/JayE